MAHPWNYHSGVTCCQHCEGTNRVAAHRQATIHDPFPEEECEYCSEEHLPECPVCGFDLETRGADCLACDTIGMLHEGELKALKLDKLMAAMAEARDKALADYASRKLAA
jgi:hypothetical protein